MEEPHNAAAGTAEVEVLPFDYSVEDHFKAVDARAKLCGGDTCGIEDDEITRLSSSITFLREWRFFNYEPRVVKFSSKACSSAGEDAIGSVTLSQFSSSTLPEVQDKKDDGSAPAGKRKDFVMYVGGPVWALDWCPRLDDRPDCHIKQEFIAVAAHPPGSSYHKLGYPLTGRGLVQIWSLLNFKSYDESTSSVKKQKQRPKSTERTQQKPSEPKRPRGRPRKEGTAEKLTLPKRPKGRPRKQPLADPISGNNPSNNQPALTKPKRPRGRPRKKPLAEPLCENNPTDNQLVQALTIPCTDNILALTYHAAEVSDIAQPPILKTYFRRKRKSREGATTVDIPPSTEESEKNRSSSMKLHSTRAEFAMLDIGVDDKALDKSPVVMRDPSDAAIATQEMDVDDKSLDISPVVMRDPSDTAIATQEMDVDDKALDKSPIVMHDPSDAAIATQEVDVDDTSLDVNPVDSCFPKDVALPRLVLCLAHNGKVAWDVKWRPTCNSRESESSSRMGYLAVVLGNGSLEVWEILMPSKMNVIYSYMKKEGTDPRFLKIEPVFRCSKLTSGGTLSIPLTVEWSPSPQQYLMAGCHDGTVALWKFCASDSPKDTRPLLCFSADTLPIRALAWAPNASDPESANVVVTAGYGGLKFWDIRDPFRPLWDLSSAPNIYSVDWPQDPRCVIFSYDDGSLKFLSLLRSLNDLPVTGKPFPGNKQKGLHSFDCSSFPTWSVHVSRCDGMVAYCSSDGTVHHFELTSKAVDKDHSRHRSPHFLCVSVTAADDESAIILNSAPSTDPVPSKKKHNAIKPEKKDNKKNNLEGPDPDDMPLALCYDGNETQSEKMAAKTQKTKGQRPRDCTSGQKVMAIGEDQELSVCSTDEEKEVGKKAKRPTETLPLKIVAMHRVRWNPNKGSERWLCSGGAAGILRCQEIRL